MSNNNYYSSSFKVPKALDKQETLELFEQFHLGNEESRDKLINHNIKLVVYIVSNHFKTYNYDKEELTSIGIIGLIKAIDKFDTSKNIEFSTFATRCIDNEILMFIRKAKKDRVTDSLDDSIATNKDNDELKYEDIISDGIDLAEELATKDTYRIIRKIVETLPERDKRIIMLHFGFYNDKIYTQKEIATILSISQSYVTKLIKKNLTIISQKLLEQGIVNTTYSNNSQKIIKEGENKEMPKKVQTIYEYFSTYSKEEIDNAINKLSDEEKNIIQERFGENLENPTIQKLSEEKSIKYYSCIIPKMKKLLANPDRIIKTRNRRKNKESSPQVLPKHIESKNENLQPVEKTVKDNPKIAQNISIEEILNVANEDAISKEDYIKILQLLRIPSFVKIMSEYSPKEAIILLLKLGYIDGKCFSSQSIASFLGIEVSEVTAIAKKVLYTYKNKINTLIDETLDIIIKDNGKESVYSKILKK